MKNDDALVSITQDGSLQSRLSSLEMSAIRTGLEELFTKRWFDVCRLDALCEIAAIHVDTRTRAVFKTLHCVSFGDMDTNTKVDLFNTVIGLFEQPVFNIDRIRALGREGGDKVH
jgi:hypothetical protein